MRAIAQQASPIVAKRVYGLIAHIDFRVSGTIAVSGFSCLLKYCGQRLFASTVLLGSAANCGNGRERVNKYIEANWLIFCYAMQICHAQICHTQIYLSYCIHKRSSSLIGRYLINKKCDKLELCENKDCVIMRLLRNGEVVKMRQSYRKS